MKLISVNWPVKELNSSDKMKPKEIYTYEMTMLLKKIVVLITVSIQKFPYIELQEENLNKTLLNVLNGNFQILGEKALL